MPRGIICRFLLLPGLFNLLPAQDQPVAVFGTTVTSTSGLEGQVYLVPEGSEGLPNFKKLKPAGSIYTTSLQMEPRHFREGFPGITDRYEWFAVDYKGRFWIEKPGRYRFQLFSDDGSKLYLDDKLVVDNDGIHPPSAIEGSAELSRGVHQIRVSYFQGPGDVVALTLKVAEPGWIDWKYFDTSDFRPAADESKLTVGTIRAVRQGTNY